MRLNPIMAACCGAGLLGASQAQALVIDHFDAPGGGQEVVVLNGTAGSTDSSYLAGLAGVLGGSRYIDVEVQSTPGGGNVSTVAVNDPTVLDHYYDYATDVNVDSVSRVIWDASGAGLDADLSGGFIWLECVSNDLPTSYTITVETFLGGTSSQTLALGLSTSCVPLVFPAAGFVGGADWSDIDRITLTVDAPQAGDARVHSVQFSVPDGGCSLALLAGGLLGLGGLRRKPRGN